MTVKVDTRGKSCPETVLLTKQAVEEERDKKTGRKDEKMFYVITFYSTYHAIKFESIHKGSGINITLMPVLREISSSCGIAAKIINIDEDRLESILKKSARYGTEIERVYTVKQENKKNIIDELPFS